MMLKFFAFCFLSLILCKNIYGQSGDQDPQPPSPNAAALGVFSQYPQSGFTGVPAINIPVYNFSYGGLSLPIQLSYNPNLVKPFHNGSWVGLGFNLTAGGSITRVVNDKPDDCSWYNTTVLFTKEVHVGFFYNHGFMASAAWASNGNLTNAINDLSNYGLKNIAQNYGYSVVKDYAPDEFSFTIGELSGTFYMDENGNFKVRCNEKVKVVIGSGDILSVPTPPLPGTPAFGSLPAIPPTPLPNQTYLNRITLIDSKGVQYVFGGAANSIEFGTTCPKTWYVTSITTTNGKTINYSYQAGQAVSYNLPGYYGTYQDGSGGRIIFQEPAPAVKSEYLKEIRTDDQVITFFSSYNNLNEFSKLDSIKVNSLPNGSQVWNFAFEYINTPMDRLKLVDVYQKDLSGKTNNKYAFTYNALQFITTQLNTDHWGYNTFNNVNGSTYNTFVASRAADTTHCRAELLSNVIYPTGGYSNYGWEPNNYSSAVNDNRASLTTYPTNGVAGGVRIKQVTDFDNNNARIGFKKYAYIKNYSPNDQANISSGVLYAQPSYTTAYDVQLPSGSIIQTIDYSFSTFLPLMDNNTGSHISYSEVAEINMDGSYTINDYSNFDTGVNNEYMDTQPDNYIYSQGGNTNEMFTSDSHERGKLLRERNYSNNSTLVSDRAITYQRINKANEFVKAYAVDHHTTYVPPSNQYLDFYEGTAYRFYTNAYLPLNEMQTQYDPNGLFPLTTNKSFTYDPLTLNLLSTTENNSKGQLVETDNAYATDMINRGTPTPEEYLMQQANNISTIIETTKKVNNTQVFFNHYDYAALTNIVFRPISQYSKFGNNTPTLLTYTFSDMNGNLTDKFKQGGVNTAYLYGYANNKPVAKIENSASNNCLYEDFEMTGTYGIAHTGYRYNDGAYNCTVNYSPNMKLTYWYRVNNVWNYAVETYTGPHAILPAGADAIDDVMLYPATAQMSVYTYDPLVGMTSSTDTKGYTTKYEYDNFNRLESIKDNKGNIIKSLCYNFAGQPVGCALNNIFYSASQTGNFYDNICGSGYTGSMVSYTVPAGKYQSTISQAHADQKAKTELQVNGQSYANKYGSCAVGTIYARVEIQNIQSASDGINITTANADVYIRFYADQSCQTPITIRSSMDVTYDINYQGNGNYPSDQYITLSADPGASEIYCGNWSVLYNDTSGSNFSLFKFSVIHNSSSPYISLSTVGDTYASMYQN